MTADAVTDPGWVAYLKDDRKRSHTPSLPPSLPLYRPRPCFHFGSSLFLYTQLYTYHPFSRPLCPPIYLSSLPDSPPPVRRTRRARLGAGQGPGRPVHVDDVATPAGWRAVRGRRRCRGRVGAHGARRRPRARAWKARGARAESPGDRGLVPAPRRPPAPGPAAEGGDDAGVARRPGSGAGPASRAPWRPASARGRQGRPASRGRLRRREDKAVACAVPRSARGAAAEGAEGQRRARGAAAPVAAARR